MSDSPARERADQAAAYLELYLNRLRSVVKEADRMFPRTWNEMVKALFDAQRDPHDRVTHLNVFSPQRTLELIDQVDGLVRRYRGFTRSVDFLRDYQPMAVGAVEPAMLTYGEVVGALAFGFGWDGK